MEHRKAERGGNTIFGEQSAGDARADDEALGDLAEPPAQGQTRIGIST
jgi:hypothetical protein